MVGDKLLIYDGKKDQGLILNKDQSLQCRTKKYYLRVNLFFFNYQKKMFLSIFRQEIQIV